MSQRQRIFDIVTTHLLTQMKKSVVPALSKDKLPPCRYRSGDLKCAVGVLIPDELYNEAIIEGKCCSNHIMLEFLRVDGEPIQDTADVNLLVSLQNIHDNHYPCDWYKKLQQMSIYLQLAFNPPV